MYTHSFGRLRAALVLLAVASLTGCNFFFPPLPEPPEPGATMPTPEDGNDTTRPPPPTPAPGDDEPEPVEPLPTQPITLFNLNIDILGEGGVEPAGGSFESGTVLTLIATPADGWRFDGWGGDLTAEQSTLTVTIERDVALTATFVQQFALTLEVAGNGTVELDPPDGPYDAGTVVALSATAGAGSQFDRWEGDADSLNPSETITMDADKLVTAVFSFAPTGGGNTGDDNSPPVVQTVMLIVATVGDGTVDIAPAGTPVAVPDGQGFLFPRDSQISLTGVDSAGGCFFHWGGDLDTTDATVQLTLSEETFVLAEFADVLAPPPAPALDEHTTHTNEAMVTITGSVPACQDDAAGMVEITGPSGSMDAAVVNGAFTADVPLSANRTNPLFFVAVSAAGVRGIPTTTCVTQDSQPPTLFIDFPPDGAEVTNDTIDVAGRVSDILTGFMGLAVTVNGVDAIVDVGIGTNGTFERQAVPLALGDNVIAARATDMLGNVIDRSITVRRVEIPAGAPRIEVVSGDGQTASIHSFLTNPLTVRVTHGDGTPFAGKPVMFDVTRSDGRLGTDAAGTLSMTLQVFTDGDGLAEAFWRMGADAGCGNNRVEVTSTSIAGTTFFCASATPAPPAQINIGTGNNQRAETGGPAPAPLRAWVNDRCNGVSDVPVTFTVIRGNGRVDDRTSVTVETSDTGHAEVEFTLGTEPGNNLVEANFATNPTEPAQFIVFGVARDETQPTDFSGLVLDNANQPIQGADCTLTVGGLDFQTDTDLNGIFRFDDLPSSGHSDLRVNGLVAFHIGGINGVDIPSGSFPSLHFEPVIIPNAENALPTPVLLPPLNPNNARAFDNTADVELTVEGLEGLSMIVRAGSMTRADGSVPSPADPAIIALNQVHFDKLPMPMPDGAAPPFAWTLQPGGSRFDPPVEIIYPNMSGLPAGSIAYFLSFNHDTMRFEIVTTGSVTDDGAHIVTDPGGGITTAGWGCNCPPYAATGDCEDCESGSGNAESAADDQCDECTVSIEGATCVRANEVITFSADPFPEGGTYDWSGGDPVGATDGPVYVTKFANAQSTSVSLTYTCEDGQTSNAQVSLDVFDDRFIVTGGLTGDVISVNLACSGLQDLALSANSNTRGFVAKRINSNDANNYVQVLKDTGRFYFVPTDTGTSELTVTGTDPDGTPSGPIVITVEFSSVAEGYSTSGPNRVTIGSTQIERHRQQQRLKHFGFPGADANPLTVNGLIGTGNSNPRWAIGLFNAAVTNADHHNSSSNINAPYINAANAPRWKNLGQSGTGWERSPVGCTGCAPASHKRGTNWTMDVIDQAGLENDALDDSSNVLEFQVADISRPHGGPTSRHSTHEGGMDIDIETPSTDTGTVPFYLTHRIPDTNAGQKYIAADTTDAAGNVTQKIVRKNADGTYSAGALTGSLANAVKHNDANYENRVLLGAISTLIVDNTPAQYKLITVREHLAAFIGAVGSSGGTVGGICYNDPRTWGMVGVSFCEGHGGHIHVNVLPPAATNGPAAPSATSGDQESSTAPAPMAAFSVGVDRLDETWTLHAGGQTVQVNPDGSFRIPNIAAPDQFGPGGPGTAPDFISDDFIRVVGVSTAGGVTRYAFSEAFQIVSDETFLLGRFTFVDEPPLLAAESLLMTSEESLLFVGESTALQVIATLPDQTEFDATERSTGTVYRTSNHVVATVSENGLVTAVGSGRAFITAVAGGTSATKRIDVVAVSVRSTVEGYVYFTDGLPVESASVTINLGGETTTDADGFFSIPIDAPENLSVTATASAVVDGTTVGGVSETMPIVVDGITDVGIITMSVQFEGLLFATPTYPVDRFPNAIESGDFDGDGDIDLVTVNLSSNSVTVLLNNGDGSYADGGSFDVGSSPRSVVVGDLNGDAVLDLAVPAASFDQITVLLGVGDGTFDPQTPIDAGDAPEDIAIGDLDGDNDPDLAVVNFNSDSVLVLLNNGDATFAPQVFYPTRARPQSLVLADLDGDDDLDIAVASAGISCCPPSPGALSILLNASDGSFAPAVDFEVGTNFITLDAGDMDGDDDVDIVITKSNLVAVMLNAGDATFTEDAAYPVGSGPVGLKLRDLDGDDDLDVAVVRANTADTAILLNQGGGTLGSPSAYLTGSTSRSVVMEDLDGDNDIDVAVASNQSDSVSIMLNHGSGVFPGDTLYDVTFNNGRFVTTGDLDNDGDPDVALTDGSKLILLFNGGHGTFVGSPSFDVHCAGAVTAVHLNDDANLDLTVAGTCDDLLWVFIGRGDGTLAPPAAYAGVRNTGAFTDVDGDGDLDAAVASAPGVSILPNNGDGTFGDPVDLSVPHFVSTVLLGDINVDGEPDLLATGFGSHSILLGAGDGTFSDPDTINTQSLASVTLDDLNGDGAPDLAGSRFLNGAPVAVVLLNLGNGTFGEEIVYGADDSGDGRSGAAEGGGGSVTVAAGDMTRDGRPDLLVTVEDRDNVLVFVNQGDGSFDNGAPFVTGSQPAGLALADLDGDGDLDAAVAVDDGLTIMLNRRVSADCNGNGILDDIDVFDGTSFDCNANGAPDVCDADCDGSGTPDDCDVADGLVDDCNDNGLPDLCEVDCNTNGIPDECDSTEGIVLDCNLNGIPDGCDLADGTSLDCDGNGRPDDCDSDCNNNGIVDRCEVADDCNNNTIPDECELHNPEDSTAMDDCIDAQPVCPGFVYLGSNLSATRDGDDAGECGDADQADDVWYVYQPAEDGTATISLCGSSLDTVLSIHSRCVSPGLIFELACNDNECGDASEITLDVVGETQYLIRIAGFDDDHGHFVLNITGPDCLIGGGDCNDNGTPDDCDLAECAGDPACDDCNGNGLPDACDMGTGAGDVLYAVQGGDCCRGRIFSIDPETAVVELVADLDAQLPNLDLCGPSGITLSPNGQTLYISLNFEDAIVAHDIESGQTTLVGQFTDASPSDIAFLSDGVTLVVSDPGGQALYNVDPATGVDTLRCNTVFFDGQQNQPVRLSGLTLSPNGVLYGSTGGNSGTPAVPPAALLIVDPAPNGNNECMLALVGSGTGFDRVAGIAFLPDGRLLGATARDLELIDINLTSGAGTLMGNFSGDPDLCSIDGMVYVGAGGDCNDNGIPDECDIADCAGDPACGDCNENGVPDSCEPDCNANDLPDECDLMDGTAQDCNLNRIPDSCDLLEGTSEDCDGNARPDECDSDCNGNGIPDACEGLPSVVFVDDNAAPGGDGNSWATAYNDVQVALSATAGPNCFARLWVATGVYTPELPGGDRAATFQLRGGSSILGGFAGNEDPETFDPDNRDIIANPTVLSGDLNGDDDTGGTAAENSFHVITAGGTDATTVLDGVIVTGGNANGGSGDISGGGMLNVGGSPKIIGCTFIGNAASNGGGLFNTEGSNTTLQDCVFTANFATTGAGVYNDGSSPTLSGCLFSANNGSFGGGLRNANGSPILKDCRFIENDGNFGGGVLNQGGGNPTLVNCTFDGNSGLLGGGMNNSDGNPTLVNCAFLRNSATSGGGGLRTGGGSSILTNCTFAGNTTFGTNGGGIANTTDGAILTNCILWGNTGGAFGASGLPVVSFSNIEGGFSGTGNIDADPLFAAAGDGDLRLTLGSPCIDTANNDALPPDIADLDNDGNTDEPVPLDLDGGDRIVNTVVDMGAYEFDQ